jgi:hypothetical protein
MKKQIPCVDSPPRSVPISASFRRDTLTFLCSESRASHMEATILETSPKLAFGFCPLMAAWVSRKNKAYAETGLKNEKINGTYHKIVQNYRRKLIIHGWGPRIGPRHYIVSKIATINLPLQLSRTVNVSFMGHITSSFLLCSWVNGILNILIRFNSGRENQ